VRKVICSASCCMLAILLGISAGSASAGQASGQFNVTVNLQAASSSEFCRSTNAPGSFGAIVTVVCSTGAMVDLSPGRTGMPWAPMHGGAHRYLFLVREDGNLLGAIDSYVGVGTVTSWRVARVADWDYIEMLVGW